MRKSVIRNVMLVSALILSSFAQSEGPRVENLNIHEFAQNVSVDAVLGHLQILENIAKANNNTREAGTAGFDLSSHYIATQLIAAGYDVRLQAFEFDKFEKLSPSEFAKVSPVSEVYEEEKQFNTMTYSPSGVVGATVKAVDLALGLGNTSTSGCEVEDFVGFPQGNIAIIQRGTCNFLQKATNAKAAGASGVVIFNQGNDESRKELFNGTLTKNTLDIPVFAVSYDLGVALAAEGTVLSIKADTKVETELTHNVLAETKEGNPENIVMIGAHLDSVGAGPGINDNGSGSAAILEVALRTKHIKPVNKIRFAWWGAEEHGLVGSRHYTANLTEEEAAKISLYLNFDMVGSPNFIYGIYDADGSKFKVPGPKGSAAIEKLFHDYFAFNGRSTIEVEANGRSDYVGFAEKGIPFGGSFTGAEVAKTEDQAKLFGGTAGEAYDKCYHKDCDGMNNINREALEANLHVTAFATLSFARSTSDVDKEKSGQGELFLSMFGRGQPQFDASVYPNHFECHSHAVWAE